MKKVLFSLMALTTMLFVSSCAHEDLLQNATGDEFVANFSISLDGAAGTRAISDGLSVNHLYWEVYDKNGKKIETISGNEEAFANGLNHTLAITLAKGQTYTFGFWAQFGENSYVATDLKRVELNYNGIAGNDETRDAFFAYTEPITVTGDFEQKVTLKRPFAQLHLAVSDLVAFEAAGISLSQVEVEVSEAAGNFDVTTGTVSGAVPATFNLADVLCNGIDNPTLTLKNGIDIDENNKNVTAFPWVSMNYLLVNDNTNGSASSNVDITFTIKTSHDDVVLTSTATPVQRNFRTNLIASLTNIGTFNLVIDPMYTNESNVVIEDVVDKNTTKEDFLKILQKGGTVVVNEVNEDTKAIDFANLTLAADLYLILNAPIETLKVGGNIDANNVIVEVSNGVAYPALSFNAGVNGDFTLKGNPASSEALVSQVNLATKAENITFDGVKFGYVAKADNNYSVQAATEIETLTFVNCSAEGLSQRLISLNGGVENLVVEGCTFNCVDNKPDFMSHVQRPIEAMNIPNVTIENNTFVNTIGGNAMWITASEVVKVNGNTIKNAATHGIKVDNSKNVTINNNNVEAKGKDGINMYYANTTTDVVVSIENNTISSEAATFYGISVNKDSETATVSGAFQIKNNKVGAAGIAGKYFGINADQATGDYNTPFNIADGVAITVDGDFAISNVNGMFWLADQVNVQGNGFAGKTVKLTADIDLQNRLWSPICQTGSSAFQGIFDGNNKTIKNLNVDETSDNATYRAAGLFGFIDSNWDVEIKGLTIEGAAVKGHHYVGTIVGYMEGNNSIADCTVKNAVVSSVFNTVAKDDGDKAGAIVGYLRGTVGNCHVVDCQVDAIRDAAQIAGAGIVANVTSCTATNVVVSHNTTAAGYGVAKDGQNIVNDLVGNKL